VPVGIGYCLRHLPAIKVLKSILEQELVGTIYNISAHVGQFLPEWRIDKDYRSSVSASKKLGGGVLLELSHELDYLQWLVGELYFEFAILRNTLELNLEVEEIADILLRIKEGTICTIHLDFIQKKSRRYCSFIGEKGRIHWDIIGNKVSLFLSGRESIIFNDPLWNTNNMYITMLRDFIGRVEKKDNDNAFLLDAIKTVQLIDEIKLKAVWGVTQ